MRRSFWHMLAAWAAVLLAVAAVRAGQPLDSLRHRAEAAASDSVRARAKCQLCSRLVFTNRYAEALAAGREGLSLAEAVGDTGLVAGCHNSLGIVYERQANYPVALEHYYRAKRLHEWQGNRKDAAGLLMNIGTIRARQNQFEQALAAYRQALPVFRELGVRDDEASCLNNIAIVLDEQGQPEAAIGMYRQAKQMFEDLGKPARVGGALSNMANAYERMGQLEQAARHYRQAFRIDSAQGNEYGMSFTLSGLAKLALKQGRPAGASAHARQALALARKLDAHRRIYRTAEILARVDSALGDFRSAYAHHKLFARYRDSVFNESKSKEIGRLEAKHELQRKQREAELRQQRQARNADAARRRRNNLQYLGISAFLALMLLGLIFIGRLGLPQWLTSGLVFVSFLMAFEFVLILADPWVDAYTGGVPLPKLAINLGMASLFTPLHFWLEGRIRRRMGLRSEGG